MNILIKDADRLLFENGAFTVSRGDICISNGKITSLDSESDNFRADKILSGDDRLVIPGLINAHTHSYMDLFRNCADDLTFSDWLFGRVMPLEDKLTFDDCYTGALLACAEMIKSGTTCFLDMHPFKNQTAKAARDTGLRAVISRGLTDSLGEQAGLDRLAQAKEEMENFKDEELITFMAAPHAVYTCSKEYLIKIRDFALYENLPINMHLSETVDEVKGIAEQYGCSPVEYVESLGLFDIHTVAAHCVQLSDRDISILAEKGVYVATNPKSNLKLANGIAPVDALLKKGAKVCIGTDSAASNNTLDMFEEMRFAALLQKGVTHDPTSADAQSILKAATITGAEALGVNSGEIAVGKNADLVMLDTSAIPFCPKSNPVSALVYSVSKSEVKTVIVNGNVLMLDGVLTTIDEAAVKEKCNRIYERING